MPLNLDHRPKGFDEIIGNEGTIKSLKSIFDRDGDFPHAILLQGSKGCGKTSLARIISEILLGMPYSKAMSDFKRYDGGDVKAAVVELFKSQVKYRPMIAKVRVFLIDEAHMIGQGGGSEKNIPQNNMLTLLEDAPKHVFFILCSTNPKRLLPTIVDRCHVFEVSLLKDSQINDLLDSILIKEDCNDFPKDIKKAIIEVSEGNPRIALKTLDQVIDMAPEDMEAAIVAIGAGERSVSDLFNYLYKGQQWKQIAGVIKKMDKSNPESIRLGILGLANYQMLNGGKLVNAGIIYACFENSFFNNGKTAITAAALQAHTMIAE